MNEYDSLAKTVEDCGYEIFWLGAASQNEISKLEKVLKVTFPISFTRFLEQYGGGGVVSAEISGIEDNDSENDSGGTVLGDTKTCRESYGLPDNLLVIYFQENEVCWCLDSSQSFDGEYPVVSYNLFTQAVDKIIAPDFSSFFKQHLNLYCSNAQGRNPHS